MKRNTKRLIWLIVGLLVLSACSGAQRSAAVQLPAQLVALIGMVVMVGVTAGFKWLGDKLGGVDLSGRAAEVAAAISAVIVVAFNYALGLVPAAYDNLLNAFFAFLIIFLGGTGFYSLFLRKKNR